MTQCLISLETPSSVGRPNYLSDKTLKKHFTLNRADCKQQVDCFIKNGKAIAGRRESERRPTDDRLQPCGGAAKTTSGVDTHQFNVDRF